jgi:hypothetical protein
MENDLKNIRSNFLLAEKRQEKGIGENWSASFFGREKNELLIVSVATNRRHLPCAKAANAYLEYAQQAVCILVTSSTSRSGRKTP